MGPSSNPLYGVIFCKAGSSFLIFEVIIQELPRPCKASLPPAPPDREETWGKPPFLPKKNLPFRKHPCIIVAVFFRKK